DLLGETLVVHALSVAFCARRTNPLLTPGSYRVARAPQVWIGERHGDAWQVARLAQCDLPTTCIEQLRGRGEIAREHTRARRGGGLVSRRCRRGCAPVGFLGQLIMHCVRSPPSVCFPSVTIFAATLRRNFRPPGPQA